MKPEYDAGKNLKEQLDAAVAFYDSEMSLQAIGDELGLNPIKVRKLLITAGVYESEVAQKVQDTFEEYREIQDYKTSIGKVNEILFVVYTERVRIEESGTKTDVTRLISARMATEFERGLYYGKNE